MSFAKITMVVGLLVMAFPFVLGLAILATMWRTWWFYPAWGWFLVPLGVPPISFWHFAALMLLVGALTTHNDTKEDPRKEDWQKLTIMFFWPMLLWALMWWMR